MLHLTQMEQQYTTNHLNLVFSQLMVLDPYLDNTLSYDLDAS